MKRARRTGGASVLFLALAGALLPACNMFERKHPNPGEEIEILPNDFRPEVLQVRLQEYMVLFGGTISAAADRIKVETEDPVVYQNALRWKTLAIPQAQLVGMRVEYLAGLLDVWALAVQLDDFYSTGAGSTVFGDQQQIAVDAHARLRRAAQELGQLTLDPDHYDRVASMIVTWCAEHPIRSRTLLRESIVPQFAESAGGSSSDIFDTLGTFEQIAVSMEKNIGLYASTLPGQARWQAELVVHEVLTDAEVRRVFEAAEDISGLRQDLPVLMDQIVAEARAGVAAEREVILADVERQRLDTLAVLQEEAETTRRLLVGELETTRQFVYDKALSEARVIAEQSVVSLEQPMKSVVDHVLLRLLQAVVVAVVLLPFLLRIYRRIVLGPVRA